MRRYTRIQGGEREREVSNCLNRVALGDEDPCPGSPLLADAKARPRQCGEGVQHVSEALTNSRLPFSY